LLVQKGNNLAVVDAAAAPADLTKHAVDLSGWSLAVIPREEWKQMFAEAWRLERDYFYDRGMHGVDWPAIRKKYEPLVERVSNRAELSDLIAQMVSELCALHIFVRGGDGRKGEDAVAPSLLGARLIRADDAGGYRVEYIYKSDPDEPPLASPLAHPEVRIHEGDVIESIDGAMTLSVPDIGQLLRHKAGRQILLRVKSAAKGESRDVIVRPMSVAAAANLRYLDWEFTRRQHVERDGKGQIGYVHLRAMGGGNFTEFAKNFYPVFTRQGLIIDVRSNRGGNIDSWVLSRLLRKAWFFWSQRVGQKAQWNMQYAFRGHIAVLCDEFTASDGEAFCEGIKRLKLGTVIGTRTWGGEIWLSANNFLVDRGIATAAEFGVYGPEGVWLIEGHGVDPDIVVDNLPHATFLGKDAQLDAAIRHLQRQIERSPVVTPSPPKGPNFGVGVGVKR
jgi:tricorn protease